jgi:glycosyltransferase involved in cell wall biosynthesis
VWKHAVHRILLKQYSAYLAIGVANREFYRFHGCHEDRIFWAPYAVDNDFFATQVAARMTRRDEIRVVFGIPREACVFLFAGKLEIKKHPMDLLEALSHMSGDLRRRVHVLMAGGGPLQSACEQSARKQGVPVTFTGFLNQSKLPDAYAAADALVLPSDAGETWGLVVNEAMACGLPAIVSDHVGCQADLVQSEHTGFVFPFADTAALGRAMRRMASDGAARRRMGANARERVADYSYERVVAGIVEALNHVLAKRRMRVGI